MVGLPLAEDNHGFVLVITQLRAHLGSAVGGLQLICKEIPEIAVLCENATRAAVVVVVLLVLHCQSD